MLQWFVQMVGHSHCLWPAAAVFGQLAEFLAKRDADAIENALALSAGWWSRVS